MTFAHLLCGPSLAGKSSAAILIADATGSTVLSADTVNAERGLPFGAEGLPESVWAETLRIMLAAGLVFWAVAFATLPERTSGPSEA